MPRQPQKLKPQFCGRIIVRWWQFEPLSCPRKETRFFQKTGFLRVSRGAR